MPQTGPIHSRRNSLASVSVSCFRGDGRRAARVLARHEIEPRQLRVEQATLEDAFLALTGRHGNKED